MRDVLLVDNAAYSYAFQLENGVPILPYFKGKNDFELPALQNYLLNLVHFDDLREENQKIFKLNRYLEFQGSV
jgi:CTD small phosphatase-like protein 2